MDDIKTTAAKLHEETAKKLEIAAKLHHDAAKHTASGNFEKAQDLATSAAEIDTVANRSALEAVDLYRQQAEDVANSKAEAAAEEAARVKKHDAKQADKA